MINYLISSISIETRKDIGRCIKAGDPVTGLLPRLSYDLAKTGTVSGVKKVASGAVSMTARFLAHAADYTIGSLVSYDTTSHGAPTFFADTADYYLDGGSARVAEVSDKESIANFVTNVMEGYYEAKEEVLAEGVKEAVRSVITGSSDGGLIDHLIKLQPAKDFLGKLIEQMPESVQQYLADLNGVMALEEQTLTAIKDVVAICSQPPADADGYNINMIFDVMKRFGEVSTEEVEKIKNLLLMQNVVALLPDSYTLEKLHQMCVSMKRDLDDEKQKNLVRIFNRYLSQPGDGESHVNLVNRVLALSEIDQDATDKFVTAYNLLTGLSAEDKDAADRINDCLDILQALGRIDDLQQDKMTQLYDLFINPAVVSAGLNQQGRDDFMSTLMQASRGLREVDLEASKQAIEALLAPPADGGEENAATTAEILMHSLDLLQQVDDKVFDLLKEPLFALPDGVKSSIDMIRTLKQEGNADTRDNLLAKIDNAENKLKSFFALGNILRIVQAVYTNSRSVKIAKDILLVASILAVSISIFVPFLLPIMMAVLGLSAFAVAVTLSVDLYRLKSKVTKLTEGIKKFNQKTSEEKIQVLLVTKEMAEADAEAHKDNWVLKSSLVESLNGGVVMTVLQESLAVIDDAVHGNPRPLHDPRDEPALPAIGNHPDDSTYGSDEEDYKPD